MQTLTDLWLSQWETPDIREQTEKLLKQLMPFYQRLHAYVRIKLKDALPNRMPEDSTIPAHLLGNMWAQQWTHVIDSVEGVDPYPNIQTLDVTKALIRQVLLNITKFNKYISIGICFEIPYRTIRPSKCLKWLSSSSSDSASTQWADSFGTNPFWRGLRMATESSGNWSLCTTSDPFESVLGLPSDRVTPTLVFVFTTSL